METPLVEKAVAKAARGPTSTTVTLPPLAGRCEAGDSSSGSKVSRSSLWHVCVAVGVCVVVGEVGAEARCGGGVQEEQGPVQEA